MEASESGNFEAWEGTPMLADLAVISKQDAFYAATHIPLSIAPSTKTSSMILDRHRHVSDLLKNLP